MPDSSPGPTAPELPYRPRDPKSYRPGIGLIGCGGITRSHLQAYKKAGYRVIALCDPQTARAEERRLEFYPEARVYSDARALLDLAEVEVVDIATHPRERVPLIVTALGAGKHVLSQKPFVLDLAVGEELADLADSLDVRLAVNQNGRWAPHFSYVHQAARAGLLGDLLSVHAGVHWDHTWTRGTPFEEIHDMIFYDFAIHWFDFVAHLLGRLPTRVYGTRSRAAGQEIRPPMLAEAIFLFDGGHGSLVFDAHVKHGSLDHTYVAGSRGSIWSAGPSLDDQSLTLYTEAGAAQPRLEGHWFPDGFHGTMGELLCSIEEDRPPTNSARENLNSLAFCFAAIASATDGVARVPGEVRRLPAGSAPGAEE